MKITDLDKRLSIQETKLDSVSKSVEEVKEDMKAHLAISNRNDEKLNNKIDKLFWLILSIALGVVGYLAQAVLR